MFAVDARGPLTYRTARTHFAAAARLAGLTDVRLHDLRRTVMTNAAAAGVTHVLRDLLGHKDYGDGGPVRAGGWLASRGRTARNRRRDGGGDGRRRGSGLTLAWHAVGILAFGTQPEASKIRRWRTGTCGRLACQSRTHGAQSAPRWRRRWPEEGLGTDLGMARGRHTCFRIATGGKQVFEDHKLYLAGDPALLVLGRPSTLAHWRSEGRGPAFIKLGSRVAYRGSDLNAWLAAQTVRPTDGPQAGT